MSESSESHKHFAEASTAHVSLGGKLRGTLWVVSMLVVGGWGLSRYGVNPRTIVTLVILGILWGIAVSGVRVAAQWEKAVILRFGKFLGVHPAGLFYALPGIDFVRFVDDRLQALNIPTQKVITRDNVPAAVDAVLFYRVADAERAVLQVQDANFAISQYAQAALRDLVGGLVLDELLTGRDQIQKQIGGTVGQRTAEWGIEVDSVRLQDIELPEDLKRMMSRQASAEREKRATITKAEGDKLAAVNLGQAAEIMARNSGAMHLRTLQTIDGLGAGPANTVVLFPIELANSLQTFLAQRQPATPTTPTPAPGQPPA